MLEKLCERLNARGFCTRVTQDGGVRVSCGQCQAVVISGLATHESGCINGRPQRELEPEPDTDSLEDAGNELGSYET